MTLDAGTAGIVGAAIGGATGVVGTLLAEPVRWIADRRRQERVAVARFGSATTEIFWESAQSARQAEAGETRKDMSDARSAELHREMTAGYNDVLMWGRESVISSASRLNDLAVALLKAATAADFDAGAYSAADTEAHQARRSLIGATRPWWRRRRS